MTLVVVGSTMGNTENAANIIATELTDQVKIIDASNFTEDSVSGSNTIILGSSTWGVGELQDDWFDKIDLLKKLDLSGKKVGFFGCGDQECYPDSFCDALGLLYDAVKDSGAEFVGSWSTDGYSFDESAALVNDSFIGLPLDNDNQEDLTEQRIKHWVKTL